MYMIYRIRRSVGSRNSVSKTTCSLHGVGTNIAKMYTKPLILTGQTKRRRVASFYCATPQKHGWTLSSLCCISGSRAVYARMDGAGAGFPFPATRAVEPYCGGTCAHRGHRQSPERHGGPRMGVLGRGYFRAR